MVRGLFPRASRPGAPTESTFPAPCAPAPTRPNVSEVKIRKKDIQEARQPDVVLEGATSAYDWIVERRNVVGAVLGGVLVLVAVASVVGSQSEASRREAGARFAAAVTNLSKPVVEKSGDAAATTDDKSFPSKEAKQKAVREGLEAVTKASAGSDAAVAASLALARESLDSGKYAEAAAAYAAYLAAHPDGDLAIFAAEGLGYAHEGKEEFDKAQAAFDKLGTLGAAGRAAFHKARLLEKQGKKDEARKAYEAVATGYEKESVAAEARARIELMDMPPPGVGALEAAPAAPAEEVKAADEDKAEKKKSRRRSRSKSD
jgi:TolA-binding protein